MVFSPDKTNKIIGCILGGAVGDALGAPLEGERDFQKLFKMFGPQGVQFYIPAISPFDDKNLKPGETTDDTASVISNIAGIQLAAQNNIDDLLYYLWQAQLKWGSNQIGGQDIQKFVDHDIEWPKYFYPFLNNTGAGRGTIAALLQGKMGTPESPIVSDIVVRGKHIKGLNFGCGGMMRVAPIGLLPLNEANITNLALRSTAITHGAPEAQAASAVIALSIKNVFNGLSITDSLSQSLHNLKENQIDGWELCAKAFQIAAQAMEHSPSCEIANQLPDQLGYKNHFLAIPVLSQVLYGALVADKMNTTKQYKDRAFHQSLSYVATISGDSDSTASILGNILGAAWGSAAIPERLKTNIYHRDDIFSAALALNDNLPKLKSYMG